MLGAYWFGYTTAFCLAKEKDHIFPEVWGERRVCMEQDLEVDEKKKTQ